MSPSFSTLNPEPMRFLTGTYDSNGKNGAMRLSTNPSSTCRKFLGLKLINEGIAAMPVEIRYRCSNPAVAKGR
jgi:hypothetical protein